MKKKIGLFSFLMLFMIASLCVWKTSVVRAATPSVVTLKTNKIYKDYDITGDGKKDKIQIRISKHPRYDYYNSLSVIINGKIQYKIRDSFFYPDAVIKIYTLKNGTPFLFLDVSGDNYDGPVNGVFQFKAGKLRQVIDFDSFFGKYGIHAHGEIVGVSDNTIFTKYYLMSFSTGPSEIKVNYKCKSKTLKRISNIYEYEAIYTGGQENAMRIFYANKPITAYSNVRANKKIFKIKKGGKVVIDKCYNNGKKMLIRVQYKGKYGWIKAQSGYKGEANKQFSNVVYAG